MVCREGAGEVCCIVSLDGLVCRSPIRRRDGRRKTSTHGHGRAVQRRAGNDDPRPRLSRKSPGGQHWWGSSVQQRAALEVRRSVRSGGTEMDCSEAVLITVTVRLERGWSSGLIVRG